MTRLYVDLETRSRRDLKKVGVYAYSECPDFSILMAAWSCDEGPIRVAIGENEIRVIPGLWDSTVIKVAHNAQFERVCLSRLAGDWLDPFEWHDTMALAAEYGYPASLDGVARALGYESKDSAGTRLINLFCKPNKEDEWNGPDTHPAEWLDFVIYCAQDVEVLIQVAERVGDWPTPEERMAWIVDQRINDAGMRIDTPMAQLAQQASEANREAQAWEFTELTGVENPGSVQQLGAWARQEGLKLPNFQSETVSRALAGNSLSPTQRRALEIRQDLALAASSKYAAALATVSTDSRVRGSFRFFGAHTGRWAGRGMQPQNLPRAAFATELEQDEAILNLKLGNGATQQELKQLVRALFVGPFTVVDYAAIEARVIAWLADETWALEAFRSGRDIYVETAQRMGGLTRSQGKLAVLSLGYSGGRGSLRVMGAEGTDDELQTMVDVWRQANQRIVRLWSTMAEAIEDGGRVGPHLRITRHGKTLKLHLPSGRAIHYHNMQWERYRVTDKTTGREVLKEGWRYDDPASPRRIGTYGGRMVENCLAGGTSVLTDTGWVRLESVTTSQRVWDGKNWVAHTGVCRNNAKRTMSVNGVRMTPDHQVLTEGGWKNASSCAGSYGADVSLPDGSVEPKHPRRTITVEAGCTEQVYDITNAGPLSRFTVWSDNGPLIVHNCTQAVARDILTEALVRLHENGYPIVGHVHDEVIVEGVHDLAEVTRLMCEIPSWAKGLPIAGEGYQCLRYKKG